MNIAIDVTPLYSGHKDRGIGTYTRMLIDALVKYEGNHSYYFFTRGQKVPNNIELIHYPFFDPYFITLPYFFSRTIVITVHDLIPLVFPAHFPSGLRGGLKWQYQRMRLRAASHIITDSAVSKHDIECIAGVSSRNITIVPLAPPKYSGKLSWKVLNDVSKRYQLASRFILYVGDVNWNKNIPGMMESFLRVRRQVPGVKLVLVGKGFLGESPQARQTRAYIAKHSLDDEILLTSSVSSQDLGVLYSRSSVYLQPSWYEGFGLPVLEAMAWGAPVVSSGGGSLAEIRGPAIPVDPESAGSMASGLFAALSLTPRKRKQLVAAQRIWIQQFSWERVAHETVLSYETARK